MYIYEAVKMADMMLLGLICKVWEESKMLLMSAEKKLLLLLACAH